MFDLNVFQIEEKLLQKENASIFKDQVSDVICQVKDDPEGALAKAEQQRNQQQRDQQQQQTAQQPNAQVVLPSQTPVSSPAMARRDTEPSEASEKVIS